MMKFQENKAAGYAATVLLFVAVATIVVGHDYRAASAQLAEETIAVNNSNFDAQQVYETNSLTADSDVKTLVITIPDNAGLDGPWEGFLPSNATVAIDTTLVVLNADVNTTHTVTVSNAETGQSVTRELPYQNTTGILLESPGEYMISDEEAQISGIVEVVEDSVLANDPITNASKPAVGLFIAPASVKSYFEAHLNRLGFNAVSSYNFSTGAAAQNISQLETEDNNNPDSSGQEEMMTLFVWMQEVAHPNTIDGRLASKVQTLEEALYPDDAVKHRRAYVPQVAE